MNEIKKKQLIQIKFKEFKGAEVLLDFTDLDEDGEFKVMWDKEEFDKLEINFTESEIQDIILSHVEQSLKSEINKK